jgi:hypothetical protein
MAIFHANAPPETMAAALLEDFQELAQTLSHLARAFADLNLRERHELDEQLEDHGQVHGGVRPAPGPPASEGGRG